MSEAVKEAVGPATRRYAYRSAGARWAFRTLDAVGGLCRRGPRPRPQAVRRALIMRPDHLGDVLFALPAIRAVKRLLPGAQVDLLLGPWARGLVKEGAADFEGMEVLEFEAPWLVRPKKVRLGLGAVRALAGMLRRRAEEIGGPYDLALDLRGDFQLIAAARLARARFVAGRGITGLGFALDAEGEEMPGRHQVEKNLALLEAAGLGRVPTENPRLSLPKKAVEEGRTLLRQGGLDPQKFVLGVHPGAGAPEKRWPPARFAQLIDRALAELPVQVALLGGADDRPAADAVLAAMTSGARERGRLADLCGHLRGLGAFMRAARACHLFLGNDSGPVHVAAALGVCAICVFQGPNAPAEWGPRGPRVMLIRCEGAGAPAGAPPGLGPPPVEPVYQAVRRCV